MKTPRDYQIGCIEAVTQQLAMFDSTLAVLPTGMGKTVVMAKIANSWERGNVLVLAHRIELLDQAAEKIGCELGYQPVVEQGERAMDVSCLWQGGAVLVGSVQTLRNEKRLAKFDKTPFDLIMIDEAHHATAKSYSKIVEYYRRLNPKMKVLGVTATPRRADETALGIVFDSVAYEMGICQAIDLGWLVPIEQEYIAVDEVNFDLVSTAKNDLGENDLKASELETVLVEEEALHAMARPIIERAAGKQCLVFTAGVAHAHMLADVLNRYRTGSARAVDGKTEKNERKDIVQAFSAGDLQFLTNFGVFTEGFDVPNVAVVAMARPTKSPGLYTQMLGRGTRPLPGVVDGPPTPEERRLAIRKSAKHHVLVMDFVGNSRHKLVSTLDILGGNYDVEVRDLARQRVAAKKNADVQDELRRAKAELQLRKEQERRRGVIANVNYSTTKVDPFSYDAVPGSSEMDVARGGSTDAQIGLLVNLGVAHETAMRYSKGQAGAVIESLKTKRCTVKQQTVLAKYGQRTDVNYAEASRIIDAIANNGWKPLKAAV